MEGVADWTMDGNPEIKTALKELGETLEDIGNIDLQQENTMINLITRLKTGRGLRLLMRLDTAYPGALLRKCSCTLKKY